MPYLPYDPNCPGIKIGLWRIEEDETDLVSRLWLSDKENARLARIKHPSKRLEWLASRVCLKRLLNIDYRVESLNEADGRPYLSDNSYSISYTHSSGLAAAIAAKERCVSIDIESRSRHKPDMSASKMFLNDHELAWYNQQAAQLDPGQLQELYITLWSAKESAYKLGGLGGTLRKNVSLDIDNFMPEANGTIGAAVQKDGFQNRLLVYYAVHSDFVLTYAFDGVSAARELATSAVSDC